MTITSTPSEVSYAGDGVTVAFPIPFVFDTAADLKVASTDSDGNVTTLTTGFSVSGGNGSTGTLTFGTAPASTVDITILDNPEIKQATDYVSNDPFPAESHERALDRLTRICKRLTRQFARTLHTQDGDPISDLTLGSVDNRKGKYLFFNAITGGIEYAANIVTTTLSQSIIGQLLNPQTLAEAAAGVTVVDYSIPSHDTTGVVNLYRYGYVGDGVADDWDAIQRGVAVINELGGGTLLFPPDTTPRIYVGTQTGDLCSFVDLNGIAVLGYGVVVTIDLSRTITASLGNFMHFSNCKNIKIDGFETDGPLLDISLTAVKSVVFARFVNACVGVDLPLNKITRWQSAYIFENRDVSGFPLADATRSRLIHIGTVEITNCWHGLHCQDSGDDLVADLIKTDTMHRSVFNYGCQNQRITVRSKNHKATDCRLLSWGDGAHTAQPLKNIHLTYISGTDSDACGNQQQKIYLGCWGDGPQVVDNIRIDLDVEYPSSGDGGGDALTLVKLTDAGGSDTTTGRGHTYNNISVHGRIKGQPTTAVGGVISTDPNCDFDGETFSGKWTFDLDVDSTTQMYLEMGSLDASAALDLNINHPGEAVTLQVSGSVITLPANPAIDLHNTRCTNRYSVVSGPRLALEYMTAGSTTPTCPAGWCKGSIKWLTTRSAGGTTTWALPAATVGMRIGAMRTDAVVFRLDPNGTEIIRGGGAGKYYGTNSDGASLILYCHTAGTWEIEQERGTWAFEP